MALGWALIARIGVTLNVETISLPLIYSGVAGISINLVLALLNLLPIPPLDGSRVLSGLLPLNWAWQYNKLERYGFIIVMVLLATNILNVILEYPMFEVQKLFFSLAGL